MGWLDDNFAPATPAADRLPTADPDGDSLTNEQEFAMSTAPELDDTDGDGALDAADASPLDRLAQ